MPAYADRCQLTPRPAEWPGHVPATTASGLYTLTIDAADATGYTVTADGSAGTSQANDTNCSTMRVRLAGGNIAIRRLRRWCPSDALTDPHRCWSR